eukprot:PDM69822.1 tyrosine phosphatase [Pristionchus pacificus]
MKDVKNLLGSKNKKKRTQDDDGGGTVAGDGGGGGKARTKNKRSDKEKKGTVHDGYCTLMDIVQRDQWSRRKKAETSPAAAATVADAAAAPQEGAEGRPLVRKKESKIQPSKMQKNDKDATCMMQPDTDSKDEKKDIKDKDGIVDPERDTKSITGRDPDEMTPEQMNNLRGYIKQYEALGVKGLLVEFETIKTLELIFDIWSIVQFRYNIVPFDTKAHELNTSKNRYKDIFCIDVTRVKLNDGEDGDYVHANYVKNEPDAKNEKDKEKYFMNDFITTQGPIEGTVNDFWRLVVQENVGYIFMLCSIVELGKKKCEVYYPDTLKETVSYLDIKVTLADRHEDGHFINSKLILEAPGKAKRYVYHHYWKNWPDRGVPITALAGIRLLRHARLSKFSTIVHCSAGVGRTGTLVALEWLLQQICMKPPPYDMKEMLKYMRNHRAHAIQTAPQYAYIAFAVFRLMALKDTAFVPQFHKFSVDMQTHTGVKIDGGAPAAPAAPAAAPPPWPLRRREDTINITSLVLFLLYISIVYSNFERSHKDYDPNPVNMEMGWGAINCIDYQEVSTLWREVTFQPALIVTCELKSHQCITIRAVNSTHHYIFQGCIPQARVSKVCTELAYEAANKNGAEYFYCYDVTYDRLNVPANMPLAGRECCCNGDFCNRIENVKTIDTIIPHDQILTPFLRTLHLWYWNTIRVVGLCSAFAIVFFWVNIVYIVLKPAEREDDSAWYAAPIPRNLINDDDNLDEEEGEEVVDSAVIDIAAAEAKQNKDVEASKKKKKGAKKRLSKEDSPDAKLPLQTEKTQELSIEDLPVAKTGDDEVDEKKEVKKTPKEIIQSIQ